MKFKRFSTLLCLSFLALPAFGAGGVRGTASVIDGDTIEIHGERIRLHAIDSPEGRQRCTRNGREWRCGTEAARALDAFIAGATVSCAARDIDRYGRMVAVCQARGVDLGEWMVRQGWALAYRRYGKDYVGSEEAARADRVGVWAGEIVPPWEWRKGVR